MSDWSMIPLHIRLTRRDKIDPNYPMCQDAKWWKLEEDKAKRPGEYRFHCTHGIPEIVVDWLAEDQGYHAIRMAAAEMKRDAESLAHLVARYRVGGMNNKSRRIDYMTENEIRHDEWLVRQGNALRDNVDSDTISMGVN